MNAALARTLKSRLLYDLGRAEQPLARLLEEFRTAGRLPTPAYPGACAYLVTVGGLIGVPVIAADRRVQALYVAMRMDGSGHTLAEMLALQTPPMSNTDREFLEGYCNGSQFEKTPGVGDYYAAKARAAGVDITGAVYMPCLASEPGDVTAWVRGRSDVIRVAEDKGMSVQGAVTVKAQDLGPPPEDITVADDLVAARVEDAIAADPDLARRDPGEVFHEVRESIKPHWGK